MSVRQYSLNGKWIYIYTVYGCSIVSTSGETFSLPSGFFAISRDEIENFFTSNYLRVDVSDDDFFFNIFSYDFAINSVQPLSDTTVPLILKEVSGIRPYLISSENYLRIISNTLNNMSHGFIDPSKIVNLGNVSASPLFVNDKFEGFKIVLPSDMTQFKGFLHCSVSVSLSYSDFDDALGIIYQFSNKFKFVGFGIDSSSSIKSGVIRSFDGSSYKLFFSDSFGVPYGDVSFGEPSDFVFYLNGPACLDLYDKGKNFVTYDFGSIEVIPRNATIKFDSDTMTFSFSNLQETFFEGSLGSFSSYPIGDDLSVTMSFSVPFSKLIT